MEKEAVIKLLSEPGQLNKVSIEQLEELVDKYPYFIKLQVLLHSKKESINSSKPNENSDKGNILDNKKEEDGLEFLEEESYDNNEIENDHDDNDDEFEQLEEEESHLPFDDESFKATKNNDLKNAVFEEPEKQAKSLKVPEEIVEEDIAYLLKKAGLANSNEADDLTLISFIQSDEQVLLNSAGLYTYSQLKKLDEQEEINLLAKLTGISEDRVGGWTEECTVLFENKYRRLLIEKIGLALNKDKNDLQKISGIGSILESKLHEAGILSFQQLALLEKTDIETLTEIIDYFPDRIERDEWVQQAKSKLKEQELLTDQNLEENIVEDNEISRLKAKVEAHKNLKRGIGMTANASMINQDNDNITEQARESFRDWLAKMNRTSNTKDEKKNLLANDLINPPPI